MDSRLLKYKLAKKVFPRRLTRNNPTRIPFIARLTEKKFFEGDDMILLPGDNLIEIDRQVDDEGSMVLPSLVVEHFIEEASYVCIMDKCLCRDAMECRDFPDSPGCIYLGEAARGVHPELGRQAEKEEALEHARKSRELGLVHMVGKSKLDTVTYEIGPGEKLFAICNCCPCCCIARLMPYVPPLISDKVSRMPGVRVSVTDDCDGCGVCANEGVCIFGGIRLENGRASTGDSCRGCGRCVRACPQNAIKIEIEHDGFVMETIDRLSRVVDVT